MSSRFKNLDFLRIIGCFAIIGFHLFCNIEGLVYFQSDVDIYKSLFEVCAKNYLAVDLFFILSGFLFAFKLDLSQSMWQFIKKKLIRFYPVMIFMLCIGLLGCTIFKLYEINLYDSVLALFCLNGIGIVKTIGMPQSGVNIFWYVSAMMWVLCTFLYLLKNYEQKSVNSIIAISIYCSYVYLIRHSSMLYTYENIDGLFNPGLCRAIGALGIGYFIAQWYNSQKEFIQNQQLNILQIILVTFIEFLCVFFVIKYLLFSDLAFNNDFIYILVYALTICLFLYKKGFISRLLDKNIFTFLAKYTYSIFMVHFYVISVLRILFYKRHSDFVINYPILNITLTYFIIFVCGIIVYYLIEEPAAKCLKKYWK